MAQREARLAYMLLLPTILVILVLVLFPVLWSVWLSFKSIQLGELQQADLWALKDFTLQSYQAVMRGRRFWPLLSTTLTYTIGSTVLALLLGLIAALVARDAFPGRGLFRGLVLFPYVTPIVAVTFVWRMMFNAQFGIVNELGVQWFGTERIAYLIQRTQSVTLFGATINLPLALMMITIFEAWRYFPFSFLFILARLQALPEELYEAAAVDGATLSQRFWNITLPQLRGVFATLFLLRFIWTFNKFDDIYLLTGGAAGTKVISVAIYEYLFDRFNVSRAAALGVVLALILAVLLVIYFRFMKEEV